ncbi:hypothetical protein P9139_02390 [Curtobacterium flaccumfaciens]|nr:hypothetical protein P9139_02390 [Curtobacterium flaccumfaciens]
MARTPRQRHEPVDLSSAHVVLAGTQELLPVLRTAAVRAGSMRLGCAWSGR